MGLAQARPNNLDMTQIHALDTNFSKDNNYYARGLCTSVPFIIIVLTQTMDRLEQMLQDSEIEYTEKIFKTEDGIGGISDQIFVSLN